MSDSYVQRAELLADLGRYDEAAAELADAGAGDVAAHTLLARIKLAAGELRAALVAADAAVAADPTDLDAMVARGMALADLGRVDDAAAQAEQILRQGSASGYACTSAAAILAGVRNGQAALDAAWQGVRLTPDQPRAHLVLGVVAAGLGLEEIAGRAYRQALNLDPGLPVAQAAAGVVRLEQQRYVRALSRFGEPGKDAAVPPRRPGPPPPRRPPAPEADISPGRVVRYGTAYALLAALLAGWVHLVGVGAGVVAVLLAAVGMVGPVVAWFRLPAAVRASLPARLRTDRPLMGAAVGMVLVPLLLVTAAGTEAGWPLVAAAGAGAVAAAAARAVG